MSLAELLVIAIIALFVINPEDLPKIAKKVKELKGFVAGVKQEILSHIDPDSKLPKKVEEDPERINFYLKKIASLGGNYEGEYSIEAIKEEYSKLVQEKIKQERELDQNPKSIETETS